MLGEVVTAAERIASVEAKVAEKSFVKFMGKDRVSAPNEELSASHRPDFTAWPRPLVCSRQAPQKLGHFSGRGTEAGLLRHHVPPTCS